MFVVEYNCFWNNSYLGDGKAQELLKDVALRRSVSKEPFQTLHTRSHPFHAFIK